MIMRECVHTKSLQFSQFSRSVVSDSLRRHESQHDRPPCPSPTPGVHSDSHPSSWWCHPAISFSVVPFTSCPQSLPASESFPISPFSSVQSLPSYGPYFAGLLCPWDSPCRIWEWVAFPSPGDLPDQGTEPESHKSPVLAGQFLPLVPLGKLT